MHNLNQPIPDSILEEPEDLYYEPFKEDDNAWAEEWFDELSDE